MKDRAYEALKERILSSEFPPGSFLAERQLAEQLGMSKTPVKAALERLQFEGLIAISPQQGIVVRDLADAGDRRPVRDPRGAGDLHPAFAGRQADAGAGRAGPRQPATPSGRFSGSGSVGRGVELDAEFHMQFAEFLGNREILRVMRQLRDKVQRMITRVFQLNPGRIDTSYDEHLAIAEATIAGDGASGRATCSRPISTAAAA